MTITYRKLKKLAFLLLALPSVIFMIGFLRWYIGIPLAALIALAYVFSVRDGKASDVDDGTETVLFVPVWCLLSLIGIVVAWCYFGGLGNLFYQSDDWFARNAIFRDLISHKWPVIYGAKDVALVYYIGLWLPSATIAKVVLWVSGSLDVAFFVGNLVLWGFVALCVIVAILCTMVFVKANTVKRFFAAIAIFIVFSGLDVIGTVYNFVARGVEIGDHVEWWSVYYQYSSMTTALFWVFNQAVLAWLAVSCFLNEKNTRNYAWIVVLCAASAPLPCVGLGLYMIGMLLYRFTKSIKEKSLSTFFRDVFTVQNLVSVFAIFPIYLLYYVTNLAVNVGQEAAAVTRSTDPWTVSVFAVVFAAVVLVTIVCACRRRAWKEWISVAVIVGIFMVMAITNPSLRLPYVFFVLLEGVIFLVPLWRDYKRNPLWHLSLLLVMLCPNIHVGTAADFCMRASIPLVFVIMALCMQYLFANGASLWENTKGNRARRVTKISCWVLAVCLALGVYTPYKEFERGITEVVKEQKLVLVDDWVYTFDQVFEAPMENLDRNFIARDYEETIFYRYLAK